MNAISLPSNNETNWGFVTLCVTNLWDNITAFDKVTLIIIDTPIDWDNFHEDLDKNKYQLGYLEDFKQIPFDKQFQNAYNILGVIHAISGNDKHAAGIAAFTKGPHVIAPKCYMYEIEQAGCSLMRLTGIIQSIINLANDNKNKKYVINCSYSVYVRDDDIEAELCREQFEKLDELDNVFLVAAVGDYEKYPEDLKLEKCIKVGAIDKNYNIYAPKIRTSKIEIYGPGHDIKTLSYENTSNCNGTPIATAFISGIAALLWEIFNTLSPKQLKNALQASKQKIHINGLEQVIVNIDDSVYEIKYNILKISPSSQTKHVNLDLEKRRHDVEIHILDEEKKFS